MPLDEGLSAAEQKFFETGTLPAELATQAAVPAAPTPPAPAPEVAVPVAAPPADPLAELKTQLDTERSARLAAESRAQLLAEQAEQAAQKVAAPAPDPGPDPATDPLGAMMHQQKQMLDNLNALNTKINTSDQQSQQQVQFQNFVASVQTARDQYIVQHPDFPQAYDHLRQVRAQDLRDAGVPEARINQALLQDELAVSANAVRQGKNPAEVMYGMAKRNGFAAKAESAAAPPAPQDPVQKILNARNGQAAALDPQRGAPTTEISLDSLKTAGDAELTRVALDDKLWAKVVGNTTPGKDIFG